MKKYEKFDVCVDCLSTEIIDVNCACTYQKYETIELEFEVCECCNNIVTYPSDTEFNAEQLKKIRK